MTMLLEVSEAFVLNLTLPLRDLVWESLPSFLWAQFLSFVKGGEA